MIWNNEERSKYWGKRTELPVLYNTAAPSQVAASCVEWTTAIKQTLAIVAVFGQNETAKTDGDSR